jgi:hypothetical protein
MNNWYERKLFDSVRSIADPRRVLDRRLRNVVSPGDFPNERLVVNSWLGPLIFCAAFFFSCRGFAMDKLVGFHSAGTMSQSMPWIAEEAGLFRKYDLDFQLVYISSAL